MEEAKKYKNLFIELYNKEEVEIVNNTTKEVFVAEDGEEFRQCWADTSTRRYFPKFWFVSRIGNVLSVKSDKIVWLNKNRRENSNKISYKFAIPTEDGTQIRNVEEHNLVGLVWGSESFGLATELLEEKGLNAFGVNSKSEDHVQGHHVSNDDTDNDVDNIKFVTDKVHVVLGNAPTYADPEEDHIEYMKELADVIGRENPKSFSVVFTGDVYDIATGKWSNTGEKNVFATNKLTISQRAIEDILELMKKIK